MIAQIAKGPCHAHHPLLPALRHKRRHQPVRCAEGNFPQKLRAVCVQHHNRLLLRLDGKHSRHQHARLCRKNSPRCKQQIGAKPRRRENFLVFFLHEVGHCLQIRRLLRRTVACAETAADQNTLHTDPQLLIQPYSKAQKHLKRCLKARGLQILIAQENAGTDCLCSAGKKAPAHGKKRLQVHAELALFKIPDRSSVQTQLTSRIDAQKDPRGRLRRKCMLPVHQLRRADASGIAASSFVDCNGRVDDSLSVCVSPPRQTKLRLAHAQQLRACARQNPQNGRVLVHSHRKNRCEARIPRKRQPKLLTRFAEHRFIIEIKRRRLLLQEPAQNLRGHKACLPRVPARRHRLFFS